MPPSTANAYRTIACGSSGCRGRILKVIGKFSFFVQYGNFSTDKQQEQKKSYTLLKEDEKKDTGRGMSKREDCRERRNNCHRQLD